MPSQGLPCHGLFTGPVKPSPSACSFLPAFSKQIGIGIRDNAPALSHVLCLFTIFPVSDSCMPKLLLAFPKVPKASLRGVGRQPAACYAGAAGHAAVCHELEAVGGS